jgi:hypothetical protein
MFYTRIITKKEKQNNHIRNKFISQVEIISGDECGGLFLSIIPETREVGVGGSRPEATWAKARQPI